MSATITPGESAFLIVEPISANSRLLGSSGEAAEAKFALLDEIANLATVPRWFAAFYQSKGEEWLCQPCAKTRNRVFFYDDTTMPWQNGDLATAIKDEGREKLLIGGFWLDAGLGASAIEAFVDGFDVHVITDLSFARDSGTRADTFRRLEQYGILPVTLHQIIFEFMSWIPERNVAAKMKEITNHPVFGKNVRS